MKIHHYYCQLYKENFWFIYRAKSYQEVAVYLKKQFNQEINESEVGGKCLEFSHNNGSRVIVVVVMPHKDKHILLGRLAHECLHAASYCLISRGIIFCDQSEEAYAYLLDTLFTEFSRKLANAQ